MRLITEKICDAFENRRALTISNSRTDGDSLWLFNNKIAQWINGQIWISNAGWSSSTTKERLNGLRGVNIRQVRGVWYLNNQIWDGSWICPSTMIFESDVEQEIESEVEFDLTSEWIASEGYSKPIYSVYHSLTLSGAHLKGAILTENNIRIRVVEADTAGKYKPNYFVVVHKVDFDRAKKLIQ